MKTRKGKCGATTSVRWQRRVVTSVEATLLETGGCGSLVIHCLQLAGELDVEQGTAVTPAAASASDHL